MKALSFAAVALLALPAFAQQTSRPATEAEIEILRDGMESRLKDAESARFRNVRFGAGEHKEVVCGEVNSKNSYGAYAGFTSFIANHFDRDETKGEKDIIFVIGIDDRYPVAQKMCADKGV